MPTLKAKKPCPTCKGKGTVPMPAPLLRVFSLFKPGLQMSAKTVNKLMRGKQPISTTHARLNQLWRDGSLLREKCTNDGSVNLYRLP